MRKNSVKVCIRTRPTQYFAQDKIKIDQEHSTIQISTVGEEEQTGILNNKQSTFKFRFDHVFHNASQSSVYDLFARDTVQGVMDGINGAILSYGQTGSGKTFTMMGDAGNYEHRGVAPRCLSQIFSEISSRIEFEFRVSCTYMEIYNERIFDLLSDLANPDVASDYTIAEERDGKGTFVRGLTEIEVTSETQALNLLFGGELSRTTATHKLNRRSNRSHSLFTIYIQQRQRSGVSERIVHSKLHLVDLAGSERLKKTMDSIDGKIGDEVTRKESMCINQSLTFLEQCVVALARRGQSHIPYRQSKLTNILKDCLGANCNTLMIACMWGESDHVEETVSTLRLASRMMRVENETSTVETIDSSALIRKQAKLIKALKQELLMHDALVERTGVGYEPYTPEQQQSVFLMLEKYVDAKEVDEEDQLSISSYRQMLEVCKQFKKMFLQARTEAANARSEALANFDGSPDGLGVSRRPLSGIDYATGGLDFAAENKIAGDFDPHMNPVGEVEGAARSGFTLGVAAADSRPSMGLDATGTSDLKAAGSGSLSPTTSLGSPGRRNLRSGHVAFDVESPNAGGFEFSGGGGSAIGQGALFSAFIHGDGSELYQDFIHSKAYVKELRQKLKESCTSVNDAKLKIDRLQKEIDDRKSSRIELLRQSGMKTSDTEDIVDEEEFRLMKELREAKRYYKNGYEQLQKFKLSVLQSQVVADTSKSKLTTQFTTWNDSKKKMERIGGLSDTDQLDDQEAFDRMETERVLANDPDSLAYFHAQKTRRALMTQNHGSLQQIRKNKRFH